MVEAFAIDSTDPILSDVALLRKVLIGYDATKSSEQLRLFMPRDDATLLDITRYAQAILDFSQGVDEAQLAADTRTQAPILYHIAVIGEAVKRLSLGFRNQHPDIPWTDIAGMRDKAIHQYDRVKLDVVWNTIQQDIPELFRLITPLLPISPS